MANSYSGQPVRVPAVRAALRKLFILYLAATTGCASTVQTVGQTSAAQLIQGGTPAVTVTTGAKQPGHAGAPGPQGSAGNPYNLPELASASADTEQPRQKVNPLLDGVGAPSDQQRVANPFNKDGQGKDFGEFQGLAMGLANSAGSQAIKDWFAAKKATAQLSTGAGERGVRFGSFDVLVPFYDTPKDVIFTQAGFRRSNVSTESYRNTVNVGVGYRHTVEDVLYGVNAFYDRDMTGKNDRLGLGAEVWTDAVKFSGNTYWRLSDWKKSPDQEFYRERPANGWDVRAEGYLPQYPQLGGKLMYEQYYGKEVGLFGASSRQKDPSATTVGVIYTPIPLISMSADYRQGQGGLSDTTVRVGLNYQIGTGLTKQLSPDEVKASRMLGNARYNLVDRKYDIVLDYKKDDAVQITLPAQVRGSPGATLSFPVTISGKNIRNVSWTGTAGSFARPYGGGSASTLVLPASETALNSYTLQAVGTDSFGRVIQSNVMQIGVDSYNIAIERTKPVALADGVDPVTFTATLQELGGTPVPNAAIEWIIDGGATAKNQDSKTDGKGQARLTLVSKARTKVQVTAKEPLGTQAQLEAEFGADLASARVVDLVATPASVVADGVAVSTLVATVQDANGNSIGAGAPISWSTSLGELSTASTVTDESGKATVTLTGKVVGDASVKATAVKGASTAKVSFTANNATAKVVSLVATPASIAANGTGSSALVATVEDASGNPVGAGVKVEWTSSTGKLTGASSVTDASGKATINLTGTTAGSATVTAKATAGAATATVALVADNATAKVIGLVATPASITANGTDSSALVATVEDASGNPVGAGVKVEWTSSTGKLSGASSVTDASGKATINLTGTTAGSATVTAKATAGAATTTVALVADNATAKVLGLVATPASITANGKDSSTLVATVQDASGNPVGAGVTVSWSTSSGKVSGASSVTDASGKATVTLTGTLAGTATVTAKAAAGASTAAVALVADNATAKVIGLVATPALITANGKDSSTLVAIVQDASGNPVGAGVSVSWSTSSGKVSGASSVTDASGKATVTLTGTVAGTATVTAKATAGASTAAVALVADNATAKVIGLVATPALITANGKDSSTLVATVQDASGNPVGAGVSVSWSTSSGKLSGASSVTDASGKATVTLTGTVAGTATVTAKAAAGASTATVALVADGSTAKVISLVATPTSIIANGSDSSTLVATVQDANGNSVGAGVQVGWSSTLGKVSNASSVTDASGKATITLSGTIAGSTTVTAKAAAGASTATVALVADNATAKVISLVATPASITANGTDSSTLVATVQDASGNPVGAGVSVSWSTSSGKVSSASSVTDASGKATVTLAGTKAGAATVTAKATAGESTATVTLVADGSTAKVIGLVATPAVITANGTDRSTLVATVQDANGNPVGAGVTVNWSTSTGKVSSASSVTDASGKATVTLTGTTAGTATITVKAAAGEATAAVALVADNTTAKVIGLVANPTSITANGTDSSTLVATVQDANGNRVGTGVPVSWSTSIGKVSSASSVTDASGKATVTLTGTKAGASTVKASAAAGDATATVQLTADATTARVVSVTGTPSIIAANVEYGVQLVAVVQDANGNPLGAGVSVNWSSTPRGDLVDTTSLTDASGKAVNRFGGNIAGPYRITASVSGGSASTTITVIANVGQATVTTLVATPATVPANGSAVSVLVATIKDGNANPVGPGVPVNWTTDFGSLSGTSTVTDSNSQAVVTLSSVELGRATVTAKAIAGTKSAAVAFIPDAATAQVVTLTSPRDEVVAAGIDSEVFTATVKDAQGHLVGAGVQVNWRNSDSRGTMSAPTSLTDANGQATMTLKSPIKAGSTDITAEAVKGGKTKRLVFISDVTTARILNIDVAPPYIVADGVDKTTFYANLTDANGNGFSSSITPLVVTWTTDFGTLSASTSISSNSSQASITLTGNDVGVANVTASVTATGSGLSTKATRVTLTADNRTARVTSLTAAPTTIRANGLAYTVLTAIVRDVRGNLAAGVQVPWATTLGTLSSASGYTDANGQVTTRLTGTVSGTATVTATAVAGGQSANVILTD